MRKFTKRSAAIATAAVVVVGAAGAAFAWTLSGSGTALATSAEIQTLSVTGVSSTPLVPGSTANVTVNVSNPNTFAVEVTGLTFSAITSTPANCADFIEILDGSLSPTLADVTVPAKSGAVNGSKQVTSTAALRLKTDAPNTCEGVEFSFAVDLDGQTVGNTYEEN